MNDTDIEEPNDDTSPDQDGDEDNVELEECKKLYEIDRNHWNPIYEKARDDLDFLSDDEESQWPAKEYNDRQKTGRPALAVDYLTQYVHQVANNIRMNTPSINPLPGEDADIEDATMIKGLIKKIEYNSCADEVYDTGATSAIKCSIGYARIDHRYAKKKGAEQELFIQRVINQFMVFPDSTFIESDGRDQSHCTILERIRVSKFKKLYPGKEVSSFEGDEQSRAYTDDEEVTIAEFFIKREEETEEDLGVDKYGKTRTRKSIVEKICRYKFSGTDTLEETTFPGEFVPVVPFIGEEAWRDGKRHIHSLIRKSKQAQYMFNLMQSVEAEILLKQPIAPVMVPAGAIENYDEDWKNPSKAMALRYDQFDMEGRPLAPPTRLSPPTIPEGVVNMGNEAINNIRATTGMYQASLGQNGQEVSGKAINARKIQGDLATYHFGDNTVRAICQIGRILVSCIPEIYDTKRLIGIIDAENKPKQIGINGALANGQQKTHDLMKGAYDVRVITGNSYATNRQESAQFYQDLIRENPAMMNVAGDLMFENMDIEGAPAMASRMKKIINPALLQTDADQQNPQVVALTQQLNQAKQVIQTMQQQGQQLEAKLKDKSDAVNGKIQNEAGKNQIDFLRANQEAQGDKLDRLIKMFELQLKSRALDITEANNAGTLALKAKDGDLDQFIAVAERIEAMVPTAPQLPGAPGNTASNNGAVPNGVINNA